jgi:hypothetical protein
MTSQANRVNQTDCQNCHSSRHYINARGLCRACERWQRRIDDCAAKLERARCDPNKYYEKYDAPILPYRICVARRVLEELRWREEGLQTDTTDGWRLEALVCTLAQVCRSEVADNTEKLIETMSAESRRKIYEVLLLLVENIPTRVPILHISEYSKKRSCATEGWSIWHSERRSSPSYFAEEVAPIRALEKAYHESLKQSQHKA